jgi:hypothetical protein
MPLRADLPGEPQHRTLFEQVNEFMGSHVECSASADATTYEIAAAHAGPGCVVTVSCMCGAHTSIAAQQDEARDFLELTRLHNMPAVQTGSSELAGATH